MRAGASGWLLGLSLLTTLPGCEVLLGYNDLVPRPADAGAEDNLDGAAGPGDDGLDAAPDEPGDLDAAPDESDAGVSAELDALASEPDAGAGEEGGADVAVGLPPDGGSSGEDAALQDAAGGADAAECLLPTGQDLCQTVPKFLATSQVVDGAGDEFCGIPAMVFDAVSCPTVAPNPPPALPASASLRVAWSTEAVHLHVRVIDQAVIVQLDRARLWDGDSVEIYIAGASGAQLSGAFDGTNDGGAIQLVLTPPSGALPARGEAFFSRFGDHAPINPSLFAGRLVAGGYELELRFPWPALANPAQPGARVALDFALGVQDSQSAGARQLQCLISDVFVDGSQACGLARGTPAAPYCDDRTWCQPELLP